MKRICLALLLLHFCALPATAGPEEALFQSARIIYQSAENQPDDTRQLSLRSVRDILDKIVRDYPSSDTAVRILLKDTIDGVDVAALDAALAADAATEARPQAAPQAAAPLSVLPPLVLQPAPAAPTTEAVAPTPESVAPQTSVLAPFAPPAANANDKTAAAIEPVQPPRPEREIVKDVQRELNRLGCNAGGADGVVGRKTEAAFERFIHMTDAPLTNNLLATEAAVSALSAVSDPVCTSRWAVKNAPAKLEGNWGYQADCQLLFRKVRITGSMTMRQTAPGQYAGTARNSLGERGPVYASVFSNSVRTRIDFPKASINSALVTSTRSMSLSGKDSNGCEIVAWMN